MKDAFEAVFAYNLHNQLIDAALISVNFENSIFIISSVNFVNLSNFDTADNQV